MPSAEVHMQLRCSRSSGNLKLSRNGLDLKLTIEKSLPRNLHRYGLPEVSVAGREVSDLRLLLARESAIGALRTEVAEEIQRRLPPPPPPIAPKEPPTEELVDFADLMVPEVIQSTADLEGWLSSLRTQLNELLKSNRIIRIEKAFGMSFDKPTRNKLAGMVGDCRRLLTEDIRSPASGCLWASAGWHRSRRCKLGASR